MQDQPAPEATSHGEQPACDSAQAPVGLAFAEADQQALEQLAEELEERLQERVKYQARLRDRIEDARDHLQELRETLSERQAAMEAGDSAPTGDAAEAEPEVPPSKPAPEPFSPAQIAGYQMPDLGILRPPSDTEMQGMPEEEVAANRRLLQDTLDSFAVDAMVCDSIVGPRITQFRVRPGFGVRVETISALERNIALAMAANSVRIQAPIPGENFVGIEIPNRNSSPLSLRGCLESRAWRESPMDIPIVMGVDINGKVVSCDLARAPHALIAGATGSGKSVCISNVILSLLYRFRPDELEMVLVDPKIVEFAIYRDLPHLIHPVVTDPKMACQVLKWLVREMEHRYEILSHKNVRNLAGYNAKAKAEGFDKLPYIVLIIDELADLMMTAPAEVETPIARLAQMSRAVGIHTILATQRPSVNVITGVIKANFPTRMAFQVSSQVDSRTILDTKGAEALQGRGDMLFNPPGIGRLQRLQAPYVDDAEIEKVVASLKEQLQPRYRVELRPEDAPGAGEGGGIDGETHAGLDPMIKQALEVIAANGRASTSYLQRKLKIGYNRAASLMEEMESRRYIGPQVGNNPREIYIQPGELDLG